MAGKLLMLDRALEPLLTPLLALLDIPVGDEAWDALDPPQRRRRTLDAVKRLLLGMRPLLAHCHLGLGKLYRRTGDQAKTEEHLATATAMYREMGMSFWLEQAEAALGPPDSNSP